jgi:hypothetical protein
MIRANKPQGGGGGIQLIQTPDGWVKVDKGAGTATPVTNAGTGDQVLPATSAVTRNRVDSAKALVAGGARMTQQLADPNFAAQIGPALGRYNTLRDFIGNPPPEYAKLAGEIESFALANMGVHGMRSTKGAEDIKSLLDQHHTPQSLAAAIDGILGFSRDLISGTGGKQPAPQQQQPAANNDPLGIRK